MARVEANHSESKATTMTRKASEPIHGRAAVAILKLFDRQSLMTLAVNRPDGRPHASTLGYMNDGLNLYFITARDSEKLANIVADPRVGIAIRGQAEEGEAVGVSIEGQAHVLKDIQEIEHVLGLILARSPEVAPWAPGVGKTVVVKVIPETLEAVAIIDGRSHARSYHIGDTDPAMEGVSYEPSAVARLF